MTNRRNLPPNRWGCKPTEDVCVEHDVPLECRHGCRYAAPHSCKEKKERSEVINGFEFDKNDHY